MQETLIDHYRLISKAKVEVTKQHAKTEAENIKFRQDLEAGLADELKNVLAPWQALLVK